VRVKVDGQYSVGLKFPSQIIKSIKIQFQIHSLLQSGCVIQVSPPQVNPASLAQLAPGQGLVVLVRVLGRGGIEEQKGIAFQSSDKASYLLRFSFKVGDEKQMIETAFQFGNTSVQIVKLQPSPSNDQHKKAVSNDVLKCVQGQMLVEAVDAVIPKALSKALTAPPTMRSFFAAAPKAGPPASDPVKSERSRIETVCDSAGSSMGERQPHSEKRQKIGLLGVPLAAAGGSPPCSDACNSAASIATPQTQRKSIAFGGIQLTAGQSSMQTSPQAGKKSFGASRKPDVKTERIPGKKQVDIFAAARLSTARPSATQPVTQGSSAVEASSSSKAEIMDLTCDD
jgi:hypothetical protein